METYAPCSKCHRLNRIPLSAEGRVAVCGACQTSIPIHGGVVEVDAVGLQKLIQKSPLPVVVDFWAPWCGPCRMFAPTYQQAAKDLEGRFVFAKLDTEAHPEGAAPHGIRSIPTLMVFQNGREKKRQSGAAPLESFKGWLQQ